MQDTDKHGRMHVAPRIKVNLLNSQYSQRPHCLPLSSSSSWPWWDSSGKPDCHSAHCSSYGQSASMCSFCLYPARGRKDTRQERWRQAFRESLLKNDMLNINIVLINIIQNYQMHQREVIQQVKAPKRIFILKTWKNVSHNLITYNYRNCEKIHFSWFWQKPLNFCKHMWFYSPRTLNTKYVYGIDLNPTIMLFFHEPLKQYIKNKWLPQPDTTPNS